MWIPYLLFSQSLTFFIPLLLHRLFQDARVQCILAGLHNITAFRETREDIYGDIQQFFQDWFNHQNWWAIKLVMCDVLNVVVIVLNILFVDWYLGYNFFTYGPLSVEYMYTPAEQRGLDPFNILFPKMTKCTLNTYGPSGSIQRHDGLCILPINVFNEKLYLLIWFLFVCLGTFILLFSLVGSIILLSPDFRKSLLCLYILPERKDLKRKLCRILDMTSFGDWMMYFLVAKNTDRVIFSQMMEMQKYPDYDFEGEPLDIENKKLEEYHETYEDKVDLKSEKKHFLKRL